jgi:HEAT repeat protein
MTRLLFVALISAVALAQEKKTEAEDLFEKAWWEETASGALDKALDGYKRAADATGPAAIRARSLYRAAIVEQRLGRTDAAVPLLERLARDFPGETELLKEAKARLQEWTAVDLRKSFSEWYRSYVYSPEFQARVVDLVLRMGTAKQEESQEAWDQLLTIGEASVPALQEALKSSNVQLRHKATQLLLRLGVIPPTEALIECPSWMSNNYDWLTLYRADEATRRRVREEAKGDEPRVRAVRAVVTSPEEMLSFALAESGSPAQYALWLLFHHSGEAMRKRLVGLIQEPTVPKHVISFLQGSLPATSDDLDLRRCLEWAKSLPTEAARRAAAVWAVNRLTDKSEEELDAVLALVPDQKAFVSDLGVPVLGALRAHKQAAGLAWTPARVGPLLDLFLKLEATGKPVLNYATADPVSEALRSMWGLIVVLPNEERGASALADALFDRIARLGPPDRRSSLLSLVHTQRTLITDLGRKEWQDFLPESLVARWPRASIADKIAMLDLAARSPFQAAVRKMLGDDVLAKDAVARATDPKLQAAIVALLGRVMVRDVLAAFDLSNPQDAQAAVETLERLAKSLTRDDATAASMGEILIHGKSPIRRRALRLLQDWHTERDAALLPAAKELVADENREVRLWAVNRLSDWNSFDASPYLVKALEDPDGDVRAAAASGLARVGREDAVPALVKLLDDPNPHVREAALAAMEQIRKIVELKKAWQLEQAGLK